MSDSENGTEQVSSVPDSGMQPSGEPQSPRAETGEFNVPSGYRLTPVDEYEKLTRASDRARGADQQFGKLKELGYDSFDAALSDLSFAGKVKQRGVGLDRLADVFGQQEPEAQEPDVRDVVREMLDERLTQQERKQAESSWNKSIDSEVKALHGGIESLATEYKLDADVLKDALENRLHSVALSNRFGDDHALKGHPNYEGLSEKVLSSFKEAMAQKAGQTAAAIGEAATKRQPKGSTPAGKAGGQGEPETTRPTAKSRKAEMRHKAEQFLEKRDAARNGAPVSGA